MNKYEISSNSELPRLMHQGKVRDTHFLTPELLLMVATDRVSAYDVVLPTEIINKGIVLNQMSAFWFNQTRHIIPNHFVSLASDDINLQVYPKNTLDRSMVVHRADRIDIECVARGYLAGSALDEYRLRNTVCDIELPSGLVEGSKLKEPIFTPATKEEEGHDENITFKKMSNIVGVETATILRDVTLKLYNYAHGYALNKGIIIADTKFEFGIIDDRIHLIDEMITPDSSRFWDIEMYEPGKSQLNYDKQYIRDWLNSEGWDRNPPAPQLPEQVIFKTQSKYYEALLNLTGKTI
jgi:phosphoribosylaminoimidazole-succinocarboxamide synthase